MSKPHKHAELIKAWADGAEIQRYTKVLSGSAKGGTVEWIWVSSPKPSWKETDEYRIKPKEKQKVKMWKWLLQHDKEYFLSQHFYKSHEEALADFENRGTEVLHAVDWSEIEVYDEQ